jgi:hypothetical protein
MLGRGQAITNKKSGNAIKTGIVNPNDAKVENAAGPRRQG